MRKCNQIREEESRQGKAILDRKESPCTGPAVREGRVASEKLS